jgi:hypothetical protein
MERMERGKRGVARVLRRAAMAVARWSPESEAAVVGDGQEWRWLVLERQIWRGLWALTNCGPMILKTGPLNYGLYGDKKKKRMTTYCVIALVIFLKRFLTESTL